MAATLTLELPRTVEAPGLGRNAVEAFAPQIPAERRHDVKLLVSELLTNSVKYGGEGPVRLELKADHGRVHGEIVDQGSGFVPAARTRRLEEAGGWGLHLVEHLADEWGVKDGSTVVWFELHP